MRMADLTLTTVPERWRAKLGRHRCGRSDGGPGGDRSSSCRSRSWKGYGGETDARGLSFETLTHGAALAALTRRIAIFSTVHVPLVHPVFAAKAIATIDHVAQGRAGLNIVCGWNQPEFDMFGVTAVADRYGQGREWHEIFARTLTETEPFDFEGAYYRCRRIESAPGMVNGGLPMIMSAAFSPPGRDFAARTSQFLLTTLHDIEEGRRDIDDIASRAGALGRTLGVFATAHVVVRETQAEAEAFYERYAVTLADHEAVDNHMRMKKAMANSYDPRAFDLYRKRFAGGTGTYPLIGTPDSIVAEMRRMHEAGYDGTTISFCNFREELPYFIDHVLPRISATGLRV